MMFEESPYYNDDEEIVGWGVWCPPLGDWIIEEDLTEACAITVARYLNKVIPYRSIEAAYQLARYLGRDPLSHTAPVVDT